MGKMHTWHRSISVNPKLILVLLLLACTTGLQAQNTKGDKPAPTTVPAKEGKSKLFGKMRSGNAKANSGRARVKNVFPQSGPFVNNPSKKPRKTQPSTVRLPSAHRVQRSPSQSDKAATRPVGGGRITAPRSSSGRITKVYPQRGPFVNNPSSKPKGDKPASTRLPGSIRTIRTPSGKDRAYSKGPISGARIPSRPNARAASRNVFPQKGPYVNNRSAKARRPDEKPNNKPLHQARRLSMSKAAAQARSMGMRGVGFQTITAQFLTRGKKDVYWGKFRKKEQAVTTDIAGRKLRTLNYHSPKAGLVGRDTLPFFRRTPKTVRRGPSAPMGGYRSATRTGKAWSGDVSGTRLRKKSENVNQERAGQFVWRRKLSVTAKGEHTGRSVGSLPRPRGRDSGERAGKFFMPRKMSVTPRGDHVGEPLRDRVVTGKRKPEKVSLRPLPPKAPGMGAIAQFQFSKRAQPRKPIKGLGGSKSREGWNNGNQPIQTKPGGVGTYLAGKFQGNVKTRRPEKGGGSVARNNWNNQNQPIEVRAGARGTRLAGLYAGNIKTRRPEKGGGSVCRNNWNNQNQPIEVRTGARGTRLAGLYAGNIKTRRPEKGGGSVSRNNWNNQSQPIEVRTGARGTRLAGLYAGNIKTRRPEKGGGSVSRNLWNNDGRPMDVKTGKSREAGTFSGRIPGVIAGSGISQIGLNYTGDRRLKAAGIENKKSSGFSSLLGGKSKGPLPATHIKRDERMAGFSGKIQGVLPGAGISQIGLNYTGARKADSYIQSPKSNKESLRKIKPNKANARISDLQVNVKMHKPTDAQMHPDARWANSLRDNVKEERTFLMNVRLTWAKLFKKSDNQPRNLKEKPGKPRFDPGEKDLWYK